MKTRPRSRWVVAVTCLTSAVASVAWAEVATTYRYDAQGQLISTARGAQLTAYSYDLAANRIAITASGNLAPQSAGSSATAQSQVNAPTTPPRPQLKSAPAGYTFVPDNSGSKPFWPAPPQLINGVVVDDPSSVAAPQSNVRR